MNKEVVYDGTADEQYDNRSRVDILRDTKDRITGYNFKILIKDKKPLEGHLSREEAEKLYRLYSSEGANLQQRSVNRELGGRFTITQFRRIVSAFKITKSITPFPPHMIEENEVDDLVQLNIQAKEDDFLKKFEQEKSDLYKKKYVDLLKENQKLKNSYTSAEYMTQNVEPIRFETIPGVKGGKSLLVYLSDIHAGAYVSSEGVYDNAYGEDEIHRRLCLVLDKIVSYSDLDNIVIFNLGDAIDGYNASTTRPSSSHVLPQNMSNKEQGRVVISQLGGFFKYILENIPHNSLQFYSVGHSNHGGDFEHSIMTALSIMLENMGVKTYVSTRPIDHFKLGDKTIIFAHGKDNLDQFKNFPLVLNDKAELYINEYINYHNLEGEILMVKGDLHQSATSYGKLFKYKSVGSLFGSSTWVMANFGFTKWCCDFTLIDEDGDMMDGIIKD